MKKITTLIHPFSLLQTIVVIDGKYKIDEVNTETSRCPEQILYLLEKHNLNSVDIGGPRAYVKHIGDSVLSLSKTKFAEKNIEINYF